MVGDKWGIQMSAAPSNSMTWKTRGRRLAAGIAALAVTANAGSALAFECRDAKDAEAAHLRWLQTQMMVAALTCQGSSAYNEFVYKNKVTLDWSIQRVNQMFARDHGTGASTQYNTFNTKLANEASIERARLDKGYCKALSVVYDEALGRSPVELVRYSTDPQRGAAVVLPATCAREALLAQKR